MKTLQFIKGEFVVEYVGELMTQEKGYKQEESYQEEKGCSKKSILFSELNLD